MTIPKLTDAQREALLNSDAISMSGHGHLVGYCIRIIDAHAADRSALVAQLKAARELLRTGPGMPEFSGRWPDWCGRVARHLEQAGYVWDALQRRWRAPGVETATWTEFRGREQ